MAEYLFYHLTRARLEQALAELLQRTLERGWRAVVRAPEAAVLDRLDEQLWLGREDAFLPHGLAGGPHDADQPVLLTTGPEAPNGAAVLFTVAGADPVAEDGSRFRRVCILFNGHDAAELAHARSLWAGLARAGERAVYWSQESGRWQKKAESGGAAEGA